MGLEHKYSLPLVELEQNSPHAILDSVGNPSMARKAWDLLNFLLE